MTNTYLEGEAAANKKAKRGRSKENRSDSKLLTLALIVNEQGFAKYSHLYAGNQQESKIFVEMIEDLIKVRPDLGNERTVIMDACIATKDNIEYLMSRENFHYIVINRGERDFKIHDTDEMRVIVRDHGLQFKLEVSRREKDGEAFLLCRSSGGENEDKGIQTRQESLFVERLGYYREGLGKRGRTKSYAKLVEMVGRLRERYPRGSKEYEVTVLKDESDVKRKKAKDIVWKRRDTKNLVFARCYVLRTDLSEMTDKDIWNTYMMLTRIEVAFRSLNLRLSRRQVNPQTQGLCDSNMFVSVLSYHILHVIEQRLSLHGDYRCWETIREALSTHQRLTIEHNAKEEERIVRYHVRLCSRPETEHKIIYQRLGVSGIPLGRRYVAVK